MQWSGVASLVALTDWLMMTRAMLTYDILTGLQRLADNMLHQWYIDLDCYVENLHATECSYILYAAQTTHMHISAMSNTVYKKKNKSDNFRARMRELIPGRSLSIEIIVDILYSIDNSRYTVCH